MTLNEATMIEAVQEYFDRRFVKGAAPKVLAVKSDSRPSTGRSFEVCTSQPEEVKEPQRPKPTYGPALVHEA